ncbi:MAG: hypothetical protein PHR96_05345 [Clostridia bacterium]|nr:hypothetical protein [Clostridia bacterium]
MVSGYWYSRERAGQTGKSTNQTDISNSQTGKFTGVIRASRQSTGHFDSLTGNFNRVNRTSRTESNGQVHKSNGLSERVKLCERTMSNGQVDSQMSGLTQSNGQIYRSQPGKASGRKQGERILFLLNILNAYKCLVIFIKKFII